MKVTANYLLSPGGPELQEKVIGLRHRLTELESTIGPCIVTIYFLKASRLSIVHCFLKDLVYKSGIIAKKPDRLRWSSQFSQDLQKEVFY